jgi:hypothetical protein
MPSVVCQGLPILGTHGVGIAALGNPGGTLK